MNDDEYPLHGCMWCVFGRFRSEPNAQGVFGPGQPVDCDLHGLVTERQTCPDEQFEEIRTVTMDEIIGGNI